MARPVLAHPGGAHTTSSHVDRVYDQLKRAIIDGTYRSGEALTEGTLARAQRASRTPIREALSRLHQEGLVDRLPGRGWFVSTVTVQLIRDTFEVRRWLEGATAAAAAERASEAARQSSKRSAPSATPTPATAPPNRSTANSTSPSPAPVPTRWPPTSSSSA